MSVLLQMIVAAVCFGMFYVIVLEMKRKNMSEAGALPWFAGILGVLILSCFPGILRTVAKILGIWWAPAILIFFLLVIIMVILFYHTIAISKLEAQLMEVAMQLTLLKEENKELRRQGGENNETDTFDNPGL